MLENWHILGQFELLFAAFAASKISFLGTMQYIHTQDISFEKSFPFRLFLALWQVVNDSSTGTVDLLLRPSPQCTHLQRDKYTPSLAV